MGALRTGATTAALVLFDVCDFHRQRVEDYASQTDLGAWTFPIEHRELALSEFAPDVWVYEAA
jgi:hypothetical protein